MLNPWDKGFVAPPPPSAEELAEFRSERGRAGPARRMENQARINAGLPPIEPDPTVSKTKTKAGRKPANPNSKHQQQLMSKTDENLSLSQRSRVDNFVECYLRTYDPVAAYLYCVYCEDENADPPTANTAYVTGHNMMKWPAVIKRIDEVVQTMEEENLLTRKTVLMGLLKEANHMGEDTSHGARVRAWMGLARIKKMDIQVVEQNVNVRGGVMLIPGSPDGQVIDVEAWEVNASTQQTKLKQDVRD